MNTHPLIIASGGSQLNRDYYSKQLGIPAAEIKLFPEIVSDLLSGYCINTSIEGSCNRRIIRRITYECLKQRQLNPEQKIIALIEITFEVRKELWRDTLVPEDPAESHFRSVQLTRRPDWWESIRGKNKIITNDSIIEDGPGLEKKFLDKWQQGELYFFNGYAENINLLHDLLMLTYLLKCNNIEYLIFRGNPTQQLSEEHVLDFFKNQISLDQGVLDLFNFSFTGWALSQGFMPIEDSVQLDTGHPNLDAHVEFGKFLVNRLNDVYL